MIRRKLPGALLVAAALIAGTALLRDDPAPATVSLPDPRVMAANGYGFDPLPEVAATWRERVRRDPDDYLSRTQLGRTLISLARETGDLDLYERAERQLRIAAADAPNDPAAQTGYAASLSAQHEFHRALRVLTRLEVERPDDLGVQASIADVHLDLGDYDAAFAAIDDLSDELPDNMATLARQARVAALTGRNEDAVELARRALLQAATIGLRPADAASAWFSLAYFQYQAGQVDEAETSLEGALTIDEGHLPSRELLGKVLVAQGRLEEAAAWYEDLVADTPAADLHGLLAEIYADLGRDDEAEEQVALGLAIAEEQVGRYPAERRHLAGFFADHDPARFLELMEEDVATREDVGGLDLLAWARYLNGDVPGAQEAIERATALGTQDAPLLFHAGMIEAAAGDADEAEDLLTAALDLNPGFDLGDVALAREALARL